jgi:hypothetical protein
MFFAKRLPLVALNLEARFKRRQTKHERLP